MPVPTSLSDLSTTPASNSPASTDTLSNADDYLRAQASIIKRVTTGVDAMTAPDINGGTIDGTTQASGTINGPIAVGGTWTAAATWTLPAHTLGGNVTSTGNPSLNIGTGALTAGAGTFSGAIQTAGIKEDASGNLGLGVTPSAWHSDYRVAQVGLAGAIFNDNFNENLNVSSNAYADTRGGYKFIRTGYGLRYVQTNGGQHQWLTSTVSGTAGNAISWGDPKMTLDGSGNLLVGTTGALVSSGSRIRATTASGPTLDIQQTGSATAAVAVLWNVATSGDNLFQSFYTEGGGTLRGSIDYNRAGGLVRYNTTSDGNLKNIIGDADLSKSVALLEATRIREYSWKDDETNKAQIGVIAQEVYDAGFKGAVSVGGDVTKTDEEGNETTEYRPWGVDKTAWTFHLVAGFQAQQKRIAELEARLAALEGA